MHDACFNVHFISPSALSQIEAGQNSPSIATLEKIVKQGGDES
ncbi:MULTISPECIES: helix-turn-helix domain-containing protein [Acidithiobacillus]|uniref:Helix-turn-helix transcriptional regulator n=1 Tax=Acidithiobacillus ferriphilus TaxID=1689834 RepID=A0ABU6FVD1_9PROT|nr:MULTISPECIES: helix-turn-helix transcriptional regulator [Acidithiobacillus]MDA8182546.1 helix-turn-helix transcriptional regulator [Acidithiobacillus sp.]MEB8486550.1 helix-turn-helix transcriptional regulator [Acidithiobacillus ferriphilus]MEB8490595.1 helix-turn-helix transcriptional regulator [Acidithiobacillus ferriphilus]MEB8492748.1 helix-turn-helix transcriptional regulator [Acidithiobacillus ferriphilus]MEB8515531.1 helix-turn-helix transcriptional regulator [Acidithiobacillus ferr